jgi:hypothetical protein
MSPEEKKVLMQTFSREEEDRQRRIDKKSLAPYELKAQQMERQEKKQKRSGGGGGGGASDLRELQLGYDLDPKAMMRNFGEYAKGGDVQSESSKLDQKNAEMDKAQAEGLNRYQAEQAKEAKANVDSRKSMPSFNFGKPEKKAKGGVVKSSASSRADGCAQRGKTRGRMV